MREPKLNVVDIVDDGLVCNDVGVWTQGKHRLVAYYAAQFSAAMKDKWDERTYIELYAGAGYSRIRETGKVIAGSPIQALALQVVFDRYIFCEQDDEKRAALEQRVKLHAPSADVVFIPGDCDSNVDKICASIPRHSRTHKVLSLCFVDPNDIGIKFATLRSLAERYVDFIVLLALYMDAMRAEQDYMKNPAKINALLGRDTWREQWISEKAKGVSFPKFLAEQFAGSMATLNYIPPPFYSMRKIFYYEKNYPLYAVGLFSRHRLAYELWDDALKYTDDQLGLFQQ